MRMVRNLCVFLVFAWMAAAQASAELLQPGRWSLRSGDKTLVILELHRSSTQVWYGKVERPSALQFRSGLIFAELAGPTIVRPMVTPEENGGHLVFGLADSAGKVDWWEWRPTPGGGELKLRDFPLEPWPFVPTRTGEHVFDAWDAAATYPVDRIWPSNAEMTAIFEADQAIRKQWNHAPPNPTISRTMWTGDQQRKARTRALLDSGALQSGNDFWHAAFIFQHGDKPEDFLLAHTLANIAAVRGRPDATWIGAATLDRYLQSIGQKQIYGTQYRSQKDGSPTQEPYDRVLISDALRQALSVPTQAEQERQRRERDKP